MQPSDRPAIPTPFGDLPRSSLLDRARMFLPQLQQSNAELIQRLEAEGAEAVQIDAGLGEQPADEEQKHAEGSGHSGDSGSDEEAEEEQMQGSDQRVVQLQFAIGDFDGSAIAKLEDDEDEEDDEESKQRGGAEGKISDIMFRANRDEGEESD